MKNGSLNALKKGKISTTFFGSKFLVSPGIQELNSSRHGQVLASDPGTHSEIESIFDFKKNILEKILEKML